MELAKSRVQTTAYYKRTYVQYIFVRTKLSSGIFFFRAIPINRVDDIALHIVQNVRGSWGVGGGGDYTYLIGI